MIVVTTPTGHVGSRLAQLLVDRGEPLRVIALGIVPNHASQPRLSNPRLTYQHDDLSGSVARPRPGAGELRHDVVAPDQWMNRAKRVEARVNVCRREHAPRLRGTESFQPYQSYGAIREVAPLTEETRLLEVFPQPC